MFDAERAAEEILSSKYNEWAYEKEVRILQPSEWYKLQRPVRRVIAGHRMPPAVLDALQIVCERRNIILDRTGIGDEGTDADSVPQLEETPRLNRKRSGGRGQGSKLRKYVINRTITRGGAAKDCASGRECAKHTR